MMSIRSISQIMNTARTFCINPVKKLHSTLSSSTLSNNCTQLSTREPLGFRNQNMILQPTTPLLMSVCGMKIRYRLKRRCKDCRLTFIDGVLHNLCSSYGRHTQKKKMPHVKATRIMTHASQSLRRPW